MHAGSGTGGGTGDIAFLAVGGVIDSRCLLGPFVDIYCRTGLYPHGAVPALPVVAVLGIIVCGAMIYGLGWTNWLRRRG